MQNAKNYTSKVLNSIDPFLCIKRQFAFVVFIELWLEIKTVRMLIKYNVYDWFCINSTKPYQTQNV